MYDGWTSWGGAFSPNLQKSIGTVSVLPLVDMTADDWNWLDYDNIRTVARNRIAASMVAGRLRGFFDVNLVEKAKGIAKPRYLVPAEEDDINDFASGAKKSDDILRNTKEVDEESDASDKVEQARTLIGFWPRDIYWYLIRVAIAYAESDTDRTELGQLTQDHILSLPQTAAEILLLSVLPWVWAWAEIDDIITALEGNETQDAVSRVVKSLVGTRQIAAGRGLDTPGR